MTLKVTKRQLTCNKAASNFNISGDDEQPGQDSQAILQNSPPQLSDDEEELTLEEYMQRDRQQRFAALLLVGVGLDGAPSPLYGLPDTGADVNIIKSTAAARYRTRQARSSRLPDVTIVAGNHSVKPDRALWLKFSYVNQLGEKRTFKEIFLSIDARTLPDTFDVILSGAFLKREFPRNFSDIDA